MSSFQTAPDLIGQSTAFLETLEHVSRIAMIDRPILVTGERGSGKSLLAARIHFLSTRWEGPLIRLSAAALSGERLEAALFGREAGASPAARRQPPGGGGAIARAQGGTVVIEEIEAASPAVQEKLLTLIEYGDYLSIGGEDTMTSDVRILATTTTNLRESAASENFRASLLDRLSFDVISAPPLRAREGDIPLLAAHFGAIAAAELAMKFPGFSPKALSLLQSHGWPGNVRELRNVAERAVFRWGETEGEGLVDEIVIDPFAPVFGAAAAPARTNPKAAKFQQLAASASANSGDVIDLRACLDAFEKELASKALTRVGFNQKAAADALGLTYDQMRGIIKKHDLSSTKGPAAKANA